MPKLTPRVRWIAVGVAVLVFGLAVGLSTGLAERRPQVPQSPATAEIAELRIAFVERLGANVAADRMLPALHGAELAVQWAGAAGDLPVDVELVRMDPWGDPDALDEALDDPSYVAAIGAPFLYGQLALGERLDAAGLPFVTLSANGPDLAANGWEGWFRAVASIDHEAAAIRDWLDASGFAADDVCLAGDASAGAAPFVHAVAARLDGRPATRVRIGPEVGVPDLTEQVRRARCGILVWGGDGEAGGIVVAALAGGHGAPVVVGGSNLRDPAFADTAGRAARGAQSAASCTDLTTETWLAAQRFIQDYQSQFARPPGPCAVEAWDVTRWLLRGIAAGAVTRAALLEELRKQTPFDGLGGMYDFGSDGEPAAGAAAVVVSRLEAGRWVSRA